MLVALLALTGLPGSVSAGSYVPPPGDCCPQWSPNGTQLVFTTNRTTGIERTPTVGAVSSGGGPEQLVPGIPVGARSPDWKHVAYETQKNGSQWLTVANVDGTGEQLLAQGADFAWSPDSAQLALVGKDGALYVVGVDGKGLAKIAPGPGAMPAWAPNGRRIAYVRPANNGYIHVVNATGGGDARIAGPAGALEPSWSPDSTQISFLHGSSIVVARLGGSIRSYPLGSPALLNNGWFRDGKALLYDAEPTLPAGLDSVEVGTLVDGRPFQDELVRLDLKTSKQRILSFGHGAELSHDGRSIAFSNGGECRDREGVYVIRADGTQRIA
jgi:Tol biopolymer transport system component